ncbi:hypothetical protein VZT92_008065 [Zoarces viviparus]|uniref:Uncharacterized protein n=1 Tax=Zoarces viviparus TaxID=48416 RepID=A0AAW1FNE4_ZOAVI
MQKVGRSPLRAVYPPHQLLHHHFVHAPDSGWYAKKRPSLRGARGFLRLPPVPSAFRVQRKLRSEAAYATIRAPRGSAS